MPSSLTWTTVVLWMTTTLTSSLETVRQSATNIQPQTTETPANDWCIEINTAGQGYKSGI